MLHIKELGPKGLRYLIMQHFFRPRYIIHNNTQKSDKYFLKNFFFIAHVIEYFNPIGYIAS